MITVARKWGNSLGVRLPKALVREAGIADGSRIAVKAGRGRIILRPVRKPRYRLEDLVRGINARNRHPAVETGIPRGREAW